MNTFPSCVPDYLRQSAAFHPGRIAVVHNGRRLTYSELDHTSDSLASWLTGRGIRPRDRVVVWLDNSPESVISFYGILKTGAVCTMVNSSVKADILAHILLETGARVLITHAGKARDVETAIGHTRTPITVLWTGSAAPQSLPGSAFFREAIATPGEVSKRCGTVVTGDDLAALIYTHGPAMTPRGVMVSHANLIHSSTCILDCLGNPGRDIVLDPFPLSTASGLYPVLTAGMSGGTVVLGDPFAFFQRTLSLVIEENVTGVSLNSGILSMLMGMEDLHKYHLDPLEYVVCSGPPVPPSQARLFRTLFPGTRLFSIFGMTECHPIACLPPEALTEHSGAVGRPVPGCAISIVDRDGNESGPGNPGELVVSGPTVAQGYWNAPHRTAKAFRQDNSGVTRFHTGKQFRKTADGFLFSAHGSTRVRYMAQARGEAETHYSARPYLVSQSQQR